MGAVKYISAKDMGYTNPAHRSEAVVTPEGMVFVSGQIGADPVTKEQPDNMYEQATRAFKTVEEIVKKAGGSKDDIIKLDIYITDRDLGSDVSKARAEFFTGTPPTAAFVYDCDIAAGAMLEVVATAYIST